MNEPPVWRVIVKRRPQRALRRLPKNVSKRIVKAIDDLAKEPRPHGSTKLSGYENLYRIRIGDWRISYAVEDEELIVLIIEIKPRGDAYRAL